MLDIFLNDKILNSDWLALVIVACVLLAATELGFHAGHRHSSERRRQFQPQAGAVQAALLGLLGLLLGFTFAMAVNRFEVRKQLVLDEANSIGTTWLRAGYLSQPARDHVRVALQNYVEARLKGAYLAMNSQPYNEQLSHSEQIQEDMWRTLVAEIGVRDTPSTALFTASLNELIDLDAKRQTAGRNHVPAMVWLLLIIVSATTSWTTGYATGLGDSGRHALPLLVLPILISIVVTIIADLDNPQRGLIQVSQQSMVDLSKTLRRY